MSIPREWTSLIGKEAAIDETIWAQSPTPAELLILPQKFDIAPKLLEVLQWSLDRYTTVRPASVEAALTEEPDTPVEHAQPRGPTPETSGTRTDSQESHRDAQFGIFSHRTALKPNTLSTAFRRVAAFKERHASQVSQGTKLSKTKTINHGIVQLAECTSCFDEVPISALIRLVCTHYYCKLCLATLILNAVQNEASYPPKCCLTEIPLALIVKPLDHKQLGLYKCKAAEYSIPADKRWYCPNSACGKWVPPSKLRPASVSHKCLSCSTKICSQCRGQAHGKRADCPQDQGLEATISLAESHGWRRCHRCRAMVERSIGCRHMTCHCGAQFCYICGAPWRSCNCTEIDEANRQRDLERRRMAMQREEDEEEEYLRRSIAVISAIEAKEAQERLRREVEEAERLRVEQEQLAKLEQERLDEEEHRRQEELALERELHHILQASLQMESTALLDTLMEVIQLQHVAFDNKQGKEEQDIINKYKAAVKEHQRRCTSIGQRMASGTDAKLQNLKAQHDEEKRRLDKQHEEQQDQLFMKIQLYLKDKPNKNRREQKMLEELQDTQQAERNTVNMRLDLAYGTAEKLHKREQDILLRAIEAKLAKAKAEFGASTKALILRTSIERKWYIVVSQRRLAMIREHNNITAEELAQGLEPVGLTAERAVTIQPLPALGPKTSTYTAFGSLLESDIPSEISMHTGNEEQRLPSPSSRSTQNNFNFVSARECVPDEDTTMRSRDSDLSVERDAIFTDLSLLDGFDPSNCSAREVRNRIRRPTHPEDLGLPRNGPAFIAAKTGEPSAPRSSSNVPDISRPPTPPDSPHPLPAVPRPNRKPVPMYIRDTPGVVSFPAPVTTPPVRRPSIKPLPSNSASSVDGVAPGAPRAWSNVSDLPLLVPGPSPRTFKPIRLKHPRPSEKQRQKARSASYSTRSSQSSTSMNVHSWPPSVSPGEWQVQPAEGKPETKLREKASQLWPFKRRALTRGDVAERTKLLGGSESLSS